MEIPPDFVAGGLFPRRPKPIFVFPVAVGSFLSAEDSPPSAFNSDGGSASVQGFCGGLLSDSLSLVGSLREGGGEEEEEEEEGEEEEELSSGLCEGR